MGGVKGLWTGVASDRRRAVSVGSTSLGRMGFLSVSTGTLGRRLPARGHVDFGQVFNVMDHLAPLRREKQSPLFLDGDVWAGLWRGRTARVGRFMAGLGGL